MSPEKPITLQHLKHKYRDTTDKRLKQVRSLGEKTGATFVSGREAWSPSTVRQAFRNLYSFFFLMMSLLVLWVGYRAVTDFTVWFDEGVAKAIVFGLPVFWFASRSRFVASEIGLNSEKLFPGLFLGLAIGGLYGFAGLIAEAVRGREIVQAAFYLMPEFWWLAFLAFLTAWWESLFFFGLPVQYVRSVASWLSDILLGSFVVVFFLLFHAPLRIIVTGPTPAFFVQMGVLALFAIGQFVVYTRTRNMYTLVLSHFFWGLVLEIYSRSI